MHFVHPLKDIANDLCSVQNPITYLGGDYGQIIKPWTKQNKGLFNFAIAFPDLYQIAMSNQAVKIIYNGLNALEDVRCERVFAAAKDFEELLKSKKLPLWTLETHIALFSLDAIGFSLGYELGIMGVLSILDLGGIPLLAKQRKEKDPIIIAGGCGATNPVAIGDFFDAVFIGEAENTMFDLVKSLAQAKKNGAKRKDLLKMLQEHPCVWFCQAGQKKVKKAVFSDFGKKEALSAWRPLPSTRPVQDHGVVEIMRGCPNGCRFCHAGIYYRPQREKTIKNIIKEVDDLVNKAGYKEISLTSLSSGDYEDIEGLLDVLQEKYTKQNVSFQLPSLKVNSFTLPLLEKLSRVRKSGLTFAVETPNEFWQLCLNKEVYSNKLEAIIKQAKLLGWNSAKFYFMIGLPLPSLPQLSPLQATQSPPPLQEGVSLPSQQSLQAHLQPAHLQQAQAIVDFMRELQQKTKIQCSVNVGIFVPKPHTPFQWAAQISPEEAKTQIDYIRGALPRGKFKVTGHSQETSLIEGLLSRGDERTAKIILQAFYKGCRLDAWEDNIQKDFPLWQQVFKMQDFDVKKFILQERDIASPLPWDNISLGPLKSYYIKQWQKSRVGQLSPKCSQNCKEPCGVCSPKTKVFLQKMQKKTNIKQAVGANTKDISSVNSTPVSTPSVNGTPCVSIPPLSSPPLSTPAVISTPPEQHNIKILYRVLFSFCKTKEATFLPYLSMQEIFYKAFIRSRLPVLFTTGFNPLPRLEFASALALGQQTQDEVASCVLFRPIETCDFVDVMNKNLIPGLKIKKCFIFRVSNLRKRESLATSLWGASMQYSFFSDISPQKQKDFVKKAYILLAQKNTNNTAQGNIIKDNKALFCYEDRLHLKEGTLKTTLPFIKQKPFCNFMQEFFDLPLYKIANIKKTATLAVPFVTGWLDTDYKKSLEKQNLNKIKKCNSSPQKIANSPVSYFVLYKRIAKINENLIRMRGQ